MGAEFDSSAPFNQIEYRVKFYIGEHIEGTITFEAAEGLSEEEIADKAKEILLSEFPVDEQYALDI